MSSKPPFHAWAERPPLGWNSWDCFATTVTEAETRAQARVMSEKLAPLGWQYIVVDIQWYEPESQGYGYREGAEVALDEWGRLLPALNRFPSSASGGGFAALADEIHALGLKFGLHLMRGIPRRAVEKNLPILGTRQRASEIANPNDRCPWNPDMFGVDMTRAGAQAYYDSVFALFASWGVDYVKLDDMSRPYHDHEPEIEAVRRAIDKTGRAMVLSFSPGETALTAAQHVKRHANLWRISDDFWDNWQCLYEQFARAERWNEHRGPGYWPDLDMLPLGVLRRGQCSSRLTREEQRTLMTLWCIARSPLMFGGDLTRLDAFTTSLITNPEVLSVNQDSRDNRLLFVREDLIAWTARAGGPSRAEGDLYLALFNARDRQPLSRQAEVARLELPAASGGLVSFEAELAGARTLVLVADDGVNNAEHPVAAWSEPRVHFADGGVLSLHELEPSVASAWWGDTPRRMTGADALRGGNEALTEGYTAPARAELRWELPPGATRFEAQVGFAPGVQPHDGQPADKRRGLRFLVFAPAPERASPESGVAIPVTTLELGMPEAIRVRDLWQRQELGRFVGSFAPAIAWHGAGLYRIQRG